MNIIKKVIISCIIIILILCVSILYMLQNTSNEIDDITDNEVNYKDYESEYVSDGNIKHITNKKRYYLIKETIDNYISYITDVQKGEQALDEILAANYKNEFNITKENITANLSKFANSEIYIEDMYEIEKTDSIILIIVNGSVKSSSESFNTLIKLDSSNKTFEIYPQEYMIKHGDSDIKKLSDNINLNSIEPQTYNLFVYREISDSELCNYYLEDYIYNVTTNIENAYNLLDEEYRVNRFGSLDTFRIYINESLDRIKNIKLQEYAIIKYPNYKQYVCIDTEGNNYLFRETAIMEYTLLLDTYTVILPEFVEKYNSSTTAQKVALNINNFIQAVNDKNYNYTYKVLNETFKTNNFTTQSDLESYLQSNFFEKNKIEFNEYLVQNGTHIYKVQISDASLENSNKINMTVIMELGNGTDFTMSFSIN